VFARQELQPGVGREVAGGMSELYTRTRDWSGRQMTDEIPLRPQLSVVVPIYNEAASIPELHRRLVAALDALGRPWELVLVDDGSTDRSLDLLKALTEDLRIEVVELNRNCGQHAALLAGFEQARGQSIVTLDGDLQNPPEEIAKLVAALDAGHDVVGGIRRSPPRRLLGGLRARLFNMVIRRFTGVELQDYGCTLRAYRREVVDNILRCGEAATFIPALANLFARSVTEVPVEFAERTAGRPRWSAGRTYRMGFDLLTGFSLFPIQVFTVLGALVTTLGLGASFFLLGRQLFAGAPAEGSAALLVALILFAGLQLLALGMIGEYIGRVYHEVRRRPRFVVRKVHRRAS